MTHPSTASSLQTQQPRPNNPRHECTDRYPIEIRNDPWQLARPPSSTLQPATILRNSILSYPAALHIILRRKPTKKIGRTAFEIIVGHMIAYG